MPRLNFLMKKGSVTGENGLKNKPKFDAGEASLKTKQ